MYHLPLDVGVDHGTTLTRIRGGGLKRMGVSAHLKGLVVVKEKGFGMIHMVFGVYAVPHCV